MTNPAGADPTAPPGPAISEIRATVLHPGRGEGEILLLGEPVSFWGGVSAAGEIIDRHHPQCGTSVTGRVLAMTSGRGSSSSSSVLAEQIRAGRSPAAILLSQADTILVLGAVVAAELYGTSLPVLQLTGADYAALVPGGRARVDAGNGSESIGSTTIVRMTR